MQERGYLEGTNIVFEGRYAEGKDERFPGLAAELVASKVDVLVTVSGPATNAARATTATIPIVMAGVSDPVSRGLAPSLARPDGNITGVANLLTETNAKRLDELARELVADKVDVIVASALAATVAASHASATIPIVMVHAGNPIGAGLTTHAVIAGRLEARIGARVVYFFGTRPSR